MNPSSLSSLTARAVATWFGCGKWPWGPGTAGSLGALLVLLPLLVTGASSWRFWVLSLCLLLLGPGIWAAGRYAQIHSRKDPQAVVVDEVLGQWLTLAFAVTFSWATFGLAFALFRLFDITKPFPVRQAERLPGGLGIVADDLVAGMYAGICLHLVGRWWMF
jgi:phosphatidylglycerophosphatase A